MELIYFVIISLQLAIGIWTIRKRIIEQSILIEMFRPQRVMKGEELIFLRRINKYGESSIEEVKEELYKNDNFQITCLSISEGTFIAHGFSTFIVKLKK
jgi:hypothetical protein